MLLVSPQAGFGNRLQVMASAAVLAAELGLGLEHTWDGNEEVFASPEPEAVTKAKKTSFNDYFDFPPVSKTQTHPPFDLAIFEWPSHTFWGRVQTNAAWEFESKVVVWGPHPPETVWNIIQVALKNTPPPKKILLQTSLLVNNPLLSIEDNARARGVFYQKHFLPSSITLIPNPPYPTLHRLPTILVSARTTLEGDFVRTAARFANINLLEVKGDFLSFLACAKRLQTVVGVMCDKKGDAQVEAEEAAAALNVPFAVYGVDGLRTICSLQTRYHGR